MVRLVISIAVTYLGTAGLMVSAADQNKLIPLVFSGMHESQYGHFSHWSGVIEEPDRIEIEYAVCNFDKRPLIYYWAGPNIGVADGGALPEGKCHILDRDVAAIDHDRSAVISFTQAGLKHTAAAHVSKLLPPILANALPSFLAHRLRTFIGPESNADQPTLADLVITQRYSDGLLFHYISWSPPTVTVAVGVDAFVGAQPAEVVSVINNMGYKAAVGNLEDMLADSSRGAIPSDRLSQPVIAITKADKSFTSLQFKTNAKLKSLSRSHISIINSETRKLVTDFEISSFGP